MTTKKKSIRFAAVFFAAAILFAGCKKDEKPAESTATPPPAGAPAPADDPALAMKAQPKPAEPDTTMAMKAKPPASAKTGAAAAHDYVKELTSPSKLTEKAPDTYKVKFDTTRGTFALTVTRAWAPLEADRFYNLVKHRFYDGAAFFRVVPGFVVQFGISANPAVTSAWNNVKMKDDPVVQSNKRGTITFAQTGAPNSRGTQVFINLKDNARLDHSGQGFAPFGIVDGDGMNVVEMMYEGYGDNGPDQDQIEKLGTPYLQKGFPKLDYIKSATLVQ